MARGHSHIKGIEGLWSFIKRFHDRGVEKDNFPFYYLGYVLLQSL